MEDFKKKFDELMSSLDERTMHLSFSSLKEFSKSPEHFVRHKLRDFVPSPAMIFGNLCHAVVLEPDTVEEKFFFGQAPTTDKQLEFANAVLSKFKERGLDEETDLGLLNDIYNDLFPIIYSKGNFQNTVHAVDGYVKAALMGMTCVSHEDLEKAKWLKERLFKNPVSAKVLNDMVQTEELLEWESFNGWKMKGFLDGRSEIIKNKCKFIMDLKFTDAEPDKVNKSITQLKYYMQAPMYIEAMNLRGVHVEEYIIIACNPKSGDISVHVIDQDYLMYGMHEYKLLCQEFNKAVMRKKFHSNFEFFGMNYGDYKGAYKCTKPTWVKTLKPIYEE